MIVNLLFFVLLINLLKFAPLRREQKRKWLLVPMREREAEWSLRWLSKQFIFLRSLSSPDSHRSDMTDQDKWSGSDVRSVQSSNCPRQKQKGTLSTRLSSLQCLFNSFHPHYVRNKTVNISRIQLFEGALFFLQFLFVFLSHWISDQTSSALSWITTCLLSLGLKVS